MCSFIALRGRWAWGLWQVQDVAVTLRESSMLWGIVAGLMGAGLAARTAPSDMVVGVAPARSILGIHWHWFWRQAAALLIGTVIVAAPLVAKTWLDSDRRRSLRLNRRPAVIRGFGGRCSPRGRDGVPPHRVAGGTCCVHRPGRNADRRQRKSPCQHGAWLGDLCMVFRNVGTGWHPHRHGRGRGHARHLLLHRHLVLYPHRQPLVQGPCRQVLLASSDALCGLDRPTAHHCCRGRRLAGAVVS